MKKFIVLLCLISVVVSCEKKELLPPNTYKINVNAPGVLNGVRSHIKIIDEKRREIIIDTAMIINEQLTFIGNVNNSSIRVLSVNGVDGNLAFILEPGEINIELYRDSIQSSLVTGTKNNDAFNSYKDDYKVLNEKVVIARNDRNANKNNEDIIEEKVIAFKDMRQAQIDFPHDFIDANPNLDLSLLILVINSSPLSR